MQYGSWHWRTGVTTNSSFPFRATTRFVPRLGLCQVIWFNLLIFMCHMQAAAHRRPTTREVDISVRLYAYAEMVCIYTLTIIVDCLMNKEPKSTDLLDWLHDIRSSWYQLGERLMVDACGNSEGNWTKLARSGWQKFSEVLTKMGEWSEISAHIYKPSWMSEKKWKMVRNMYMW